MRYFILTITFLIFLTSACTKNNLEFYIPKTSTIKIDRSYFNKVWLKKNIKVDSSGLIIIQSKFNREKLILNIFLKIDSESKKIDLLAMDTFGIKLFLLSVSKENTKVTIFSPSLNPFFKKLKFICQYLKFIFSFPTTNLLNQGILKQKTIVFLQFKKHKQYTEFYFDKTSKLLIKKKYVSKDNLWEVVYSNFCSKNGIYIPKKIKFKDKLKKIFITIQLAQINIYENCSK
ncbi:hypothetical protein SAMN04488516_11432 [Desulfonauticus submarinus]|uniref:Lipoprotein n=1 Tax=Desulfonauticus submarinus TaxID=206665 RepID=A0A1H0FU08_9BACT|nr:hypothetical protein SAMN04488516_11432 [Desulfonauticus submarinus]